MPDDPTPEPEFDAEMDAALKDAYAFAPAAAEEAAARFRLPAPRRRIPWIPMAAAAAAGILIGFTLMPKRVVMVSAPNTGPPGPPPPAGFVVLATRDLGIGRGRVRAGSALFPGNRVEVPADGRASIILSDGSEVRLDRGAVVTLGRAGVRELDLAEGRLWSRVSRGEPFRIEAGETRVTVLGTELTVARSAERTRVQLHSGNAMVAASGAGHGRELAAGQEIEFAGGKLSEVRRTYSEAIATGWMLELYAYAGRHERDLADHMDRMLAEMGQRKMAYLEEEEIVRDLAPVCRIPVARFLVSEAARAPGETAARRKAARVLVRIADASVATELAAALRDPDAEVRVSAAHAIRRVSDGTACALPEAFREACDDGAAAAADAWARSCSPAPPPPK